LWTSRCSPSGFRRKDKFHTQICKRNQLGKKENE
jgi:hypothetical protein